MPASCLDDLAGSKNYPGIGRMPGYFNYGYTDMVGDAATNVKLSQARAQAVVTALTTRNGVASARLVLFGAGRQYKKHDGTVF